jgi:hypothetical protein
MSLKWQFDFSYGYFKRILQVIKSNFTLAVVPEAPKFLNNIEVGKPKLILRHDIDVSLKRGLRTAEIENEFGVPATYMVMTNSSLYCIKDQTSRDILRQLINLGHEVGLHFDLDEEERNKTYKVSFVEAKIHSAYEELENIIGLQVRSISFHRPVPQIFVGPLMIGGRVNAYAKELMAWYLSDSKGYWREGEPLPKLVHANKPLLQMLVHPIWWGNEHMLPEDRLQEFFDTETQGQSYQYVKALDTALAGTIPAVRRRGFHNDGTGGEK